MIVSGLGIAFGSSEVKTRTGEEPDRERGFYFVFTL
jgi:hypothetical protein